jgi:dTDP-L-rhamnose 4-epimerase
VRVLDALDPQVHGANAARPAHLHAAAELQVGDVRDRGAVRRALDGVEAVFHLAAAVGVGQSMYEIERYVSVNSVGAAVLLEELVAARARIARVVVASSMSIYGEGAYRAAPDGPLLYPPLRSPAQLAAHDFELRGADGRPLVPAPTPESKPLVPTSVYAVTKRDHEELFHAVGAAYGIPTVALRYFNCYGPRQSLSNPYTGVIAIFASRLLGGHAPPIYEDGGQSRDFVHVSDVAAANLLALERDAAAGGVYNVGTGRGTSVREVARLLARALGAAVEPEIVGRFRAGDVRHCIADPRAAARDLGFAAATPLEDGVRELLAWLRTQSPVDRVGQARKELESRGLTS